MMAVRAAPPSAAPQVSVVIPAYRAASFILDSVGSVIEQSFGAPEIIVVNDGSPDTAELEQALSPVRDRIVYLVQENAGPSAARNAGLRIARGDWVGFLDADDQWEPDFLREQIAYLDRHPVLDLVYADALLVGDPRLEGRTFMDLSPSAGEVTVESLVSFKCNVITSGVLVRRRVVLEAGMFDTAVTGGVEDFDLWLRMLKIGARFGYQPKVLARRRLHAESLSTDVVCQYDGGLAVLRTFALREDLTREEEAALAVATERFRGLREMEVAKLQLAQGDFAAARAALRRANAYYRDWRLHCLLTLSAVSPRLLSSMISIHAALRRRLDRRAGNRTPPLRPSPDSRFVP